jgi:hypothetical protein
MSTTEQPAPDVCFTVEKNRFYREGERYSNGSGFQGMTRDRAEAENWFAAFSQPGSDEVFSLELRAGATVLKRSGPPQDDAVRSMRRAYRERYPKIGTTWAAASRTGPRSPCPRKATIDEANTALAVAATRQERLHACEALIAAAEAEAQRLRAAIAKAVRS